MPQLYFAGGGWVAVVMVVGVAGLLFSTAFISYKEKQCNSDYKNNLGDDFEINNVDVNADQEKSREETQNMKFFSVSDPIVQNINKNY